MPITALIGVVLLGVVIIPIVTAATGPSLKQTPRLIRDHSRQKYQATKEKLRPRLMRAKRAIKKRCRYESASNVKYGREGETSIPYHYAEPNISTKSNSGDVTIEDHREQPLLACVKPGAAR